MFKGAYMNLPYSENLEIQYLTHLFDNMSECYKLFWFQGIIDSVVTGREKITFGEIIDNMIADAWYMVSEYHLNLGPSDALESLVHMAFRLTGLKSSEKRERILEALQNINDKEFQDKKRSITNEVPYRLQAPFIPDLKGKDWRVSKKELAHRINQEKRLIYYFVSISGLKSEIYVDSYWIEYIRTNREILKGWVQYHLIQYLQKRNPSVPGIVNKIYPPQDRKLGNVRMYWKAVVSLGEVCDIYDNQVLTEKNIVIDHFIPWSYVAHDELWNLHPTTRSINSQKSNYLPEWQFYFERFSDIEYQAYQSVWRYEKVRDAFDKCLKEHINSMDIRMRLYRPGIMRSEFRNNLEEIVLPVYQSAKDLGFQSWTYSRGK